MGRTEHTRLAILRAAERLFLERGVEHVSLREIAIEAAQRNSSAPSYHFGDKRGLVEAILERHSEAIQMGWLATLSHTESQHTLDLRELVTMLVAPIVAKLDDPDGGPAYLAICAELVTSQSIPLASTRVASGPGAVALGQRIGAHARALEPAFLMLRMMRIAALLYVSINDYLRMTASGLVIGRDAFVADLVDTLVTVLGSGRVTSQKAKGAPAKKAPRAVMKKRR